MTVDTSVYVHFPFCLKRCPYCDFASSVVATHDVPHVTYGDALLRDLKARGTELRGRRLTSVFFGGGTPSVWEAGQVSRVLQAIRDAFDEVAKDLEVSLECNPSSLDRPKAAALRRAGVGRLSVGLQSLDDEHLRFLGRLHDTAGGLRALGAAFAESERVSADIIFGVPGQRWARLRDDVSRLLDLGLRHLSAYALSIEAHTPFGELQRAGELRVASEDDFIEIFEGLGALLADRGLAHYEVSSYAAPGERSMHNMHYWRGRPYLGLGAAAVGCLDLGVGAARRYRNVSGGTAYIAAAGSDGVEAFEETLDPPTLVREALMLGLRTSEGTDLVEAGRRAGVDPLAGREDALERRARAGDVVLEEGRLRVPPERWLRLDGIVADLF